MKAKVLKALATLQFEVLAYIMRDMGCKTVGQLADKFSVIYTKEDVNRLAKDVEYAYENRKH